MIVKPSTPRDDRQVAAWPEITARGFVEDDVIFDEVRPKLEAALDEAILARCATHPRTPAGDPPRCRGLGGRRSGVGR